jgi:hypothetical protein
VKSAIQGPTAATKPASPLIDHAPPARRASAPAVRAACACGGGCSRCGAGAPGLTPTGGAATTALESEADRFADRMTASSAGVGGATGGPLARFMAASPPSLVAGLGGGERVPSGLRTAWERRSGVSLDGVRIHRDARAGALAARHDTDAIAAGTHIALEPEAWSPTTLGGQRLLAHEIAHVIQQAFGYATVQRNGRRRRRRPPVLDAAGRLAQDDVELLTLVTQLELALTDFVRDARGLSGAWGVDRYATATREIAAADAAAADLRRDGYTAAGIDGFLVHATEASAAARDIIRALGRADDARLTGSWRRVGELVTAIRARPSVRAFHRVRADEGARRTRREAETARRDYPTITRAVRAFLHDRRRMRLLRTMPRALSPELARFLTERLGTESVRWQELFAYMREHDSWTFYAIQLDGTFLRDLEHYHNLTGLLPYRVRILHDPELVLAHVVLGEFEELSVIDDGMVNEVRGTRYETPWIAYAIDIVLGVVPYLGTALDIRDVIALAINLGQHYTTDDAPGGTGPRHDDGAETGWTWFRLVLTLVGLIPAIGDALKAVGKAVGRVGRGARVLSHVSVGRIVTQIERHAPEVLEMLERLMRAVGGGWSDIVRRATTGWDEIMAAAITRLRPINAALADAMARARAASPRFLPAAFDQARRVFTDVFVQLRNAGNFWGRGALAVLNRARRWFASFTPDGRLANALEDFERLDRAVMTGLLEGNRALVLRSLDEIETLVRAVTHTGGGAPAVGDAQHGGASLIEMLESATRTGDAPPIPDLAGGDGGASELIERAFQGSQPPTTITEQVIEGDELVEQVVELAPSPAEVSPLDAMLPDSVDAVDTVDDVPPMTDAQRLAMERSSRELMDEMFPDAGPRPTAVEPRPPAVGPSVAGPPGGPGRPGTRYARPEDYVLDQSARIMAARPAVGVDPRAAWARREIRVVQPPNRRIHRMARHATDYRGRPFGYACALDLETGRTAAVASAPDSLVADAARARGIPLAPRNGGHANAAELVLGLERGALQENNARRGLVAFTAIDHGRRGIELRLESTFMHELYRGAGGRVPPAIALPEIQRAAQVMFPGRPVFFAAPRGPAPPPPPASLLETILATTEHVDDALPDLPMTAEQLRSAEELMDELLPDWVARRPPGFAAGSRLPPPIEAPQAGDGSWSWRGRNEHGHRVSDNVLNPSDLREGPRARHHLPNPEGWEGRIGYHRSHLLADQFGGGRDVDNLFTGAGEANSYGSGDLRPPSMLDVEEEVAEALRAGQTVRYRITLIQSGVEGIPEAIVMQARGSGGLDIDVVIRNWTHHR